MRKTRLAGAIASTYRSVEPNVLEFTFQGEHGKTLMIMVRLGFASTGLRDKHEHGLPDAFARIQRIVSR